MIEYENYTLKEQLRVAKVALKKLDWYKEQLDIERGINWFEFWQRKTPFERGKL